MKLFAVRKLTLKSIAFLIGGYLAAITLGCGAFDAEVSDVKDFQSQVGYLDGNIDGAALYKTNCAGCHGDLGASAKLNRSAVQIDNAIIGIPEMSNLAFLTGAERFAIANALAQKVELSCDSSIASFSNIHRLDNSQYNNVVRDLTGLDLRPADKFPLDGSRDNFTNIAEVHSIDEVRADQYFNAAVEIMEQAISQNRDFIVTCNSSGNKAEQRQCAQQVIQNFGLRAFRRPLKNDELEGFLALYDQAASGVPAGMNGFNEGIKGSLTAVLVSPQFLFRIIEMPQDAAGFVKALDSYELASRLSFTLWGSIPDQRLLELAATNQLQMPAVLDQEIDRMLLDEKANYIVKDFASRWLKLFRLDQVTRDQNQFPNFNNNLRASMIRETELMLRDMLLGQGKPSLLLKSNYTYVDNQLADLYDIPGPSSANFTRVSTVQANRSGIITNASILSLTSNADRTNIVTRGIYVLENLLCTSVPPAPDDVNTEIQPNENGIVPTNPREIAAVHAKDNRCSSCHSQIDPVGLGLENFDPIGQWRTSYSNGEIVDASGTFPTGESFVGHESMIGILAESPKFKSCVSRKIMTFALGRALTTADACSADTLGLQKIGGNQTYSDLLKGVIMSNQFRQQQGEQ